MPSGRDGLEDESLASEASDVLSFADLLCGETVAVGGEGAFGVRSVEPGFAEEVVFGECELSIDGFGDEEVDAVIKGG